MTEGVKQLFQIPVLLVFCQNLYGAVCQECTPEKLETSILGMMLRRHIYKRITGVEHGHVCLLDCYQDVRCQCFNYVISQYMCELNNRTKEARPEDYVPDSDRYYFGREMNRGKFIQRKSKIAKQYKQVTIICRFAFQSSSVPFLSCRQKHTKKLRRVKEDKR